jgi:hypothetical protein
LLIEKVAGRMLRIGSDERALLVEKVSGRMLRIGSDERGLLVEEVSGRMLRIDANPSTGRRHSPTILRERLLLTTEVVYSTVGYNTQQFTAL